MVHLSETNQRAIHDFALLSDYTRIQGQRLEALYKLIQKRGSEIIGAAHLKGVKMLEYKPGQYVGIQHTPLKKGHFFPCKLKTVTAAAL